MAPGDAVRASWPSDTPSQTSGINPDTQQRAKERTPGPATPLWGAGTPWVGPAPRGPGAATHGQPRQGDDAAVWRVTREGRAGPGTPRRRDRAAPQPSPTPGPLHRLGLGSPWSTAPRPGRMRSSESPPRLTIRQRVPPPPARTRALAASGRPLNGSLFRSRQPGPQGCRGAAGGARRGERCGGHRGGRAGAKRSFTCGILDVSEGDRPPRSGERALSDCGHLTRIPGRASRANRNALKGRCDQWAGARRAAAQ